VSPFGQTVKGLASINCIVSDFKLTFFLWVIPRCLNFIRRRFGTLCSIFIGVVITPPMKMEQSVPKRWHIKSIRRGITQKKSIQLFHYGNLTPDPD